MNVAAKTNGFARSFPSQGVILDLAGLPVDASGWVWHLNSARAAHTLKWLDLKFQSHDILEATVLYFKRLVETKSPDSVRNTFSAILHVSSSPSFAKSDHDGTAIESSFFSDMQRFFGSEAQYRLHYLRHWYRFCVDQGCSAFSEEVAFELDARVVGGNKKGHAVLSLDPSEGPLNDLEITALLNALRAAGQSNYITLAELAALWLCIAFGSNPLQLALLRESDVIVIEEEGRRFIQVNVPRVKKRTEAPRREFRLRKLNQEIGQVILDLMDENRRRRDARGWWDSDHALPLFVRGSPRTDEDGPMSEYARHLYASELTALVRNAVDSLEVISPRTGRRLEVTPRRLRYTYATRLVREGVSKRELADLLDHTDLQNVQVYFDIKSDIVESLDKAMALALGPVAQAFLGKIVRAEPEAVRGDDPSSRVKTLDKTSDQVVSLGTCGQHSFCGFLAPVACYTCAQFQPWMDGPHDVILNDLLATRDRKLAAGQDGRMVAIYDSTILAIGDVISRIEAARAGEAA